MVEPQFEIFSIPEPISLPFESFDFVDQTLDSATGDGMIEVVEKAGMVCGKGLDYLLEGLDPRVHCISAPDGEKLLGLLAIRLVPEQSQLLFHGVNLKKRTIDAE